jgi:putative oxidoreductase
MIKQLLSSRTILEKWFIILRIVTGVMIARYGLEVFNKTKMDGNFAWLTDIHFPAPVFMAYLGKGAELIGGIFLMLGLFTRFAAVVLIINMLVIIFIMGAGNIFENEQLPFLLMILFICFLFQGGGELSLDHLFFNKKRSSF